MWFKKYLLKKDTSKIYPIQYPIYELDCTKYNGIYLKSRQVFLSKYL